jgi:hypothetical protein
MRKVTAFLMIFAGTMACVFVFNIALYTMLPEYKNLIRVMVPDRDIPVVEVSKEAPAGTDMHESDAGEADIMQNIKPDSYYKLTYIDNESVALTDSPSEDKPAIVDKEYHEDCGTGKGYWVITYDDGTTEIE